MSDHVSLLVPGEPVPQQRARKGKAGHWYTPTPSRHYSERVQTAWMVEGRQKLEGPLALRAIFHFCRPPTHLKKNGSVRKGAPRFPPRADTSNLVKGVEDALNGLLYRDDAAIVTIVASKVYSDEAFTEIHVQSY